MEKLPYNKVCCIEDFSHPDLIEIIKDIFQYELADSPQELEDGILDSKQWETAMCVRALRDHGALDRNSTILGVGAGVEVLNFYLTKYTRQVFATDLYLEAGAWSDVAPFFMLVDPERFSPLDFENERLVVQDMDGRCLEYPDAMFDAVYSSRSVEHFGSLKAIASAAYEMGRVLKPGGILTLSTEFKVSGPAEGDGWDINTLVLSPDRVRKFIVEASGLELVDEIDTRVSEQTMLTRRDLAAFLEGIKKGSGWQNKAANYPNIVLTHQGYAVCSIHLTMKKTEQYPVTENEWAAPDADVKQSIMNRRNKLIATFFNLKTRSSYSTLPSSTQNLTDQSPSLLVDDDIYAIIHHYHGWQNLRLSPDQTTERNRLLRNSKPLSFLYRTAARIRKLGKIFSAESFVFEIMIGTFRKTMNSINYVRGQLSEQDAYLNSQIKEMVALIDKLQSDVRNVSAQSRKLEAMAIHDTNKATFTEQQLFNQTSQIEELRNTVAQLAAELKDINQPEINIKVPGYSEYIPAKLCKVSGTFGQFKILVQKDAVDDISTSIINRNFTIDHHYNVITELVSPGARVLDLGAHIGTFSLYAGRLGYDVLSVEASPRNIALLQQSAIENNFTNIDGMNVAVSDHTGTIKFFQNGPWGHVVNDAAENFLSIKCMTVEDILAEKKWDSVDFIKMDIEGSEIDAIHGMESLLSDPQAPSILFESNAIVLSDNGHTTGELMKAFLGFGYHLYALREGQYLFRIDPDEMQLALIEECIALKGKSLDPLKWRMAPKMTTEEKINHFLTMIAHPNADFRLHAARLLNYGQKDIFGEEMIVSALNLLKNDPVKQVRDAVSWINKKSIN